jgi:hypothetical protein
MLYPGHMSHKICKPCIFSLINHLNINITIGYVELLLFSLFFHNYS